MNDSTNVEQALNKGAPHRHEGKPPLLPAGRQVAPAPLRAVHGQVVPLGLHQALQQVRGAGPVMHFLVHAAHPLAVDGLQQRHVVRQGLHAGLHPPTILIPVLAGRCGL
eukprot:scaffold271388_cov35-Prasinocladus_malaysianus.AAC.2